jgi:acyl-CoA reductase-like NAD-dependent aldehyde dehydrogenase
VTAKYRNGPRKVNYEGGVYLRPTVIHAESVTHPLYNREYLCPFATVVQVPQAEMLKHIGYTLACSAITKDAAFIEQLYACGEIDRLNIGPVSTMKISWDQPHEGNMFEFLWQRRSIERGW